MRASHHSSSGYSSPSSAEVCIRALWRGQWPAYAALAIAVGAALFALTYVIALDDFTTQIALVLILGLFYAATNSYLALWRVTAGVTHAPSEKEENAHNSPLAQSWKHRVSHLWHGGGWFFALGIILLAPLSVPLGLPFFIPADVATDSNLLVATVMGWVTLGTLFVVRAMVGTLFGSNKPLPLSTPLLPALSLFGLLHIISVDTPVMFAFLVYVAAALYLVSYESFMLRREEVLNHQSSGAHENSASAHHASTHSASTQRKMRNIPAQYLAVCGVWMLAFSVGAVLVHYPLSAVLPTSFLVDFARNRSSNEADTADWRSASRVMELRGGSYPVSDRPVMRVRADRTVSSTVWRGRVYEQYISDGAGAARWEVFLLQEEETHREIRLRRGQWGNARQLPSTGPPQVRAGLERALPALPAKNGGRTVVTESFEPLANFSSGPAVPVYSMGEPLALRGNYSTFAIRTDGTLRLWQPYGRARSFTVRSAITDPNLGVLNKAKGLSKNDIAAWKRNVFTRATLQLPQDPDAARVLRAIAMQIRAQSQSEGRPLNTPHQKALAIGQYLVTTCEYSLSSPAVPPGEDGAAFFLTNSRRGACDMFASAMALLMRAMDVPSRVATGFRQPETPDDETGLIHTIREKDAHAWVEYFMPEFGWVRFDPTDGTREADTSLGAQMLQLMKWPALFSKRQNLYLPAMGAMLLLIGIVWTLWDKYAVRRVMAQHQSSFSETDLARRRAIQTYAQARKLLAHRVPAKPGHTALEYENAVMKAPLSDESKQEFAALTYLLLDAQYGPHGESARHADSQALQNALSRLRQALKHKPPKVH